MNKFQVLKLIEKIRDAEMHVGMAIKPGTPVEHVFPYASELDLVLILTVEPGFGGQAFMEDKVDLCMLWIRSLKCNR